VVKIIGVHGLLQLRKRLIVIVKPVDKTEQEFTQKEKPRQMVHTLINNGFRFCPDMIFVQVVLGIGQIFLQGQINDTNTCGPKTISHL